MHNGQIAEPRMLRCWSSGEKRTEARMKTGSCVAGEKKPQLRL